MSTYREVSEKEKAEADAIAKHASIAAHGVVTPVLVTTARLSAAAVASDDPVTATRKLRSDPDLLRAIDVTARLSVEQSFKAITDAILSGYEDDAHWRGDALTAEAPAAKITLTIDHEDKAKLRAYPIQGHTPAEVAEYLTKQLRYGIDGALSVPLSKKTDPQAIPAALGEVSQMHADRVGNAAREAYFAGVQAATQDLAMALTGK